MRIFWNNVARCTVTLPREENIDVQGINGWLFARAGVRWGGDGGWRTAAGDGTRNCGDAGVLSNSAGRRIGTAGNIGRMAAQHHHRSTGVLQDRKSVV